MSPEQCRGENDLTFSSDIYSLGATLFHLVTGRPPFIARTPGMVIVAHISEPAPDPGVVIRTLRPATRDLIIRAMGKHPKERHRSYDLFISAAVGARKLLDMGHTQRTAPSPGQRRMSGEDFQDMIEEVASDSPRGRPLSGADALREVSTRMIRRNQPASGLHRRLESPDQPATQPPAPRFAIPRPEPQQPKPAQPPAKPAAEPGGKTSSFFRKLLKPPGG
jgi:serine/threonine protein kinase